MAAETRTPQLDEMANVVARAAGLSPEQASLAVTAMLHFMMARMPSALVGELHARLGLPAAPFAGRPLGERSIP